MTKILHISVGARCLVIGAADLITCRCINTWTTAHFLQRFVAGPHLFTHTFLMECYLALFLVTIATHCLLVGLEHCDVGVVAAGCVLVVALQH